MRGIYGVFSDKLRPSNVFPLGVVYFGAEMELDDFEQNIVAYMGLPLLRFERLHICMGHISESKGVLYKFVLHDTECRGTAFCQHCIGLIPQLEEYKRKRASVCWIVIQCQKDISAENASLVENRKFCK